MSDKGRQNEDQKGSQKKLLKQEKRLRDRLLEAQQAQDNALERLRRAEARLRKRVERVQRLEGRLSIVDQQMKALNAPLSTIVTLIPTVAESAAKEAARSSKVALEQSSVQAVDAVQQVPEVATVSEQPGELESTAGEMVVGEAEPQFLERFSASIDTPLEDEEVSTEEAPAASILNPAIARAREARAVAEAAEEAARDAIERAEDVAEYLEQIGSARHLMQELAQLEDEAAQAAAYAREAEEAAREAERAAAESEGHVPDEEIKLTAEEEQIIASIPPEEERDLDLVEEQGEEESPLDVAQPDMQAILLQQAGEEQPASINGETPGVEIPASLSEVAGRLNAQADGAHTYAHPVVKVEEIDEEEEALETVAAMIIADAAAIAAAEAEALAEASSARTREARSAALAADRALGTVRMAVRNGVLLGDEAASALKIAERDATHAHAVLADAEAAEERARNTAMNAEAEAEVAEGMAFASGERTERDEKLRAEYGTAHPLPEEEPVSAAGETNAVDFQQDADDADQDDREETQKLPRVRPEQA